MRSCGWSIRRWPRRVWQHGRRALAELSAAVLGHPERKLAVSAVTGTNGKTTTAYLLEQMLRSVGRECVLIGTIETRIGDEVRASPHTTPESQRHADRSLRTACRRARPRR